MKISIIIVKWVFAPFWYLIKGKPFNFYNWCWKKKCEVS